MDRELAELHRGAREERKRMADTQPPAQPRDGPETCDWRGCDSEAVTTRENPLAGASALDVCDDHRAPPRRY